MKTKHTKFALLVTSALIGFGESNAGASVKEFTLLEEMTPDARSFIQAQVELANPDQKIDWDNLVAGMTADGKIEIRNKGSLEIQEVSQPSCFGRQ